MDSLFEIEPLIYNRLQLPQPSAPNKIILMYWKVEFPEQKPFKIDETFAHVQLQRWNGENAMLTLTGGQHWEFPESYHSRIKVKFTKSSNLI